MSKTRFAILYTLAWLVFAVLYSAIVGSKPGVSPSDAAWSGGTTAAIAAIPALVVWWMTGWIRRRLGRVAQLAAHAAVAIAYATVWSGLVAFMIWSQAPAAAYQTYMEQAFWWQVMMGFALYGLVAGIAHAAGAAREAREQQALAARADALRVRAELRALRAQLNPHFLFNTLHSITALVRSDPKAVEDALERFGALLRYVLDVNRARGDEVTLEDELTFVRTYLALERLRLGARLQVVEEIDPEALECAVLAFTLQPLVENAIRHGIAPQPRGGTLRMAAHFVGERLELEVADDGAGTDPVRVTHSGEGEGGIGLQVVRQRLEARYGADATFDIVTAPHNGFLVRVAMPAAALRTTAAHPVVTR